MTPPFRTERQGQRRSARQIASIVGVGLLHIAAVAFLAQATFVNMPTHPIARAIEIWFVFPPKVQAKPKPREEKKPERGRAPQTMSAPGDHLFTVPSWFGKPKQGGISQTLLGCEPDHIALLSPAERAKCPSVAAASRDRDKDAVDYTDHTDRSKDRALWARGRARKNAPPLLPCASPYAAGVSLGTLLCLAKGVADGFDLDAQPGYMDKLEIIHVPNNGDPATLKTPTN
jgi:hypothetical protein